MGRFSADDDRGGVGGGEGGIKRGAGEGRGGREQGSVRFPSETGTRCAICVKT